IFYVSYIPTQHIRKTTLCIRINFSTFNDRYIRTFIIFKNLHRSTHSSCIATDNDIIHFLILLIYFYEKKVVQYCCSTFSLPIILTHHAMLHFFQFVLLQMDIMERPFYFLLVHIERFFQYSFFPHLFLLIDLILLSVWSTIICVAPVGTK